MAETFLEEIYRYSKIIFELEAMAAKSREWLDEDAVHGLNGILPELYECIKVILDDDAKLGQKIWESLKRALQVEEDLTKLADIVELEILPAMYLWMAEVSKIEIEDEDGDFLKSTRSGFLTLKYNGYYLHSAVNPMLEAQHLLRDLYDPEKKDYYVFGCGLGYHVYQLYQKLSGYGKIFLFEPNGKLLEYAKRYGVLSWIPGDDLVICRQFESVEAFLQEAERQNAGVFIHVPSSHAHKSAKEKKVLIEKWMSQNTRRLMARSGRLNRIRNDSLGLPDVAALLEKMNYEEAVVVAAGPSVDQCLETLRSWAGNKLIIAVGTILKKLLAENIVPDMVVFIDYDCAVGRQMQEVRRTDIPLVIAREAYWGIAHDYQGPKYLIGTDEEKNIGFGDKRAVWMSGGTVSYTALELAIHTNPRAVYLVGLDLGYPMDQRYARGVTQQNGADDTKLFCVEAMDGGYVKTDLHLNKYRESIEGLIARTPDIRFYNLSESGALIRGAEKFSPKRKG